MPLHPVYVAMGRGRPGQPYYLQPQAVAAPLEAAAGGAGLGGDEAEREAHSEAAGRKPGAWTTGTGAEQFVVTFHRENLR